MGNKDKFILKEVSIDARQKQKILKKISEAVEEKRYLYHPSLWEIFRGQLKYISGFCLGGQILCFAFFLILLGYFQRLGGDMTEFLGIGSGVSAGIGVFLMVELSRSRDYGVAELEQVCYLNLKQVWCVKMILFGSLDILMLTAMAFGIAGNTSLGLIRIIVYLLAPFVMSNVLQLFVFTLLRSRKGEYLQIGAAAVSSGLSLLPLSDPGWYTAAYFGVWVCVLAAALLFLVREIIQVYHNLEEGEGICWN